jgi:hypothetical protein
MFFSLRKGVTMGSCFEHIIDVVSSSEASGKTSRVSESKLIGFFSLGDK